MKKRKFNLFEFLGDITEGIIEEIFGNILEFIIDIIFDE